MQKPVVISRSQAILTEHVGHLFLVHNGKAMIKIRPVGDMVGMKYGEFAKTRTPRSLSKKGSKKA